MKTTPRLYVDEALGAARDMLLSREQTHYLTGVLRLGEGDPVRVFNGRDGEWLGRLLNISKKSASIRCETHLADASAPPDIDYLFAPLKHARLDYVVQKATELGARRLRPVITARTIAGRVNLERMRANAIEAAEQCNLVFVPEIAEPEKLEKLLAAWDKGRALVYCDETAEVANPLVALKRLRPPAAVLIGPEGGFTEAEKALLKSCAFVTAISMGPRIMRADTAAVAALALVQAAMGDWHQET
ncbi:MAG: 16S rRNA (uracil(1498)-N(3))-methyltransferase [Rhizobiales bacterium]|nr:16S rRNA (uracil(1498)-N(3))-methyltransferase [Hyphomicrobiales bacterium]